MHSFINRNIESKIKESLKDYPVVAIIGPRQCGKSTLARHILSQSEKSIYLDLEKTSDLAKLEDAETFFIMNKGKLICLDEIQRAPELFPLIRSMVDFEDLNLSFMVLGSALPELLRQSSESLAGRIRYWELTPFIQNEVKSEKTGGVDWRLWLRGGFPRSYLARNDNVSMDWRKNFIRTFLERDLNQLGISFSAQDMERFWLMCAHVTGQLVNLTRLGGSLGVSHHAARKYLDVLEQTFMIRQLQPYLPNLGKRLVKSPKIYFRDSGLLHALLDLEETNNLLGHPVFGSSFEGYAIECILGNLPGFRAYFYRTSNGSEIDLILERGNRRIAVEFKATTSPKPRTGFYHSLSDLGIQEAYIVSFTEHEYPMNGALVVSIPILIEKIIKG